MTLFQLGNFIAASGKELSWKLECDALTTEDLNCLAALAWDLVGPFRKVVGVPRGGQRFAEHLKKFENPTATAVLLVDDVFTTGSSIRKFVKESLEDKWPDEILVIFDRSDVPPFDFHSLLRVNRHL